MQEVSIPYNDPKGDAFEVHVADGELHKAAGTMQGWQSFLHSANKVCGFEWSLLGKISVF